MTSLLPFLFVLSGAAGLIYEVVWARELVLVFGNTSQAVSTILTGFFGGLAVGSFFGGRTADRVRRPLRMYGVLELILVALVLLTPISFRLLGEIYRGIYPALSEMPLALGLVRFVLAIIALAPATILMGATLPTLTRYLSARTDGLAGAFTRLYAANTLGAIVGTFVAGFVLIELLGLQGALLIGAICSGTAGVIALLLDLRAGPVAAVGAISGGAASPATERDPQPAAGRQGPSAARAASGLRKWAHVARLPGRLESSPGRRNRQLDLRVHDHPDAVPGRDCRGRADLRSPPATTAVAASTDRRGTDRDSRPGCPGLPGHRVVDGAVPVGVLVPGLRAVDGARRPAAHNRPRDHVPRDVGAAEGPSGYRGRRVGNPPVHQHRAARLPRRSCCPSSSSR